MKIWTDEQIKWLVKRYWELKDEFGVQPFKSQLRDEFNSNFQLERTTASIDKACHRYKNEPIGDDSFINNLKTLRSNQRTGARIRKQNKTILDQEIDKETFLKEFKKIIKNSPVLTHKKVSIKKSNVPTERILVGHISDTHIGVNIDPEELGNVNCYGPIEEARRHAFFFNQIANYKTKYRESTELVLILNGDLMQGVIHNQEDVAVMTTQFARALSIYTQGISYLAGKFKRVRVICTTGNHARFMHKSDKGRATSKKWDGFHTMLNIGLQTSLQSFKNVEFEIPVTPYAFVDILNHKYFIAHGDTVINVGNVSKNINMGSIAAQTNEISSALGKFDVLVVGHVHKATYQILDNGIATAINGCLSGTDPFAQSIGILHNNPIQQLWEVTKDHCIGDIRFIRLKEADKMENLDKIIKPFTRKF